MLSAKLSLIHTASLQVRVLLTIYYHRDMPDCAQNLRLRLLMVKCSSRSYWRRASDLVYTRKTSRKTINLGIDMYLNNAKDLLLSVQSRRRCHSRHRCHSVPFQVTSQGSRPRHGVSADGRMHLYRNNPARNILKKQSNKLA